MKYSSKKELIDDIAFEHARFLEIAASISTREYNQPGVWGDEWTIKDLFNHLMEWEQLFLTWYQDGLSGELIALPAEGFKWSETPKLNQVFYRRNKRKSFVKTKADFDSSYDEIFILAKSLAPKKLFHAGEYTWTKKNPLVSYLSANTSSHYRTASKILKRWLRQQKVN